MTPEDLAQALLDAEDAEARRTLLIPRLGDFYTTVVGLLKEESDRVSLRDPNAALRAADVAAEVAEFAAV